MRYFFLLLLTSTLFAQYLQVEGRVGGYRKGGGALIFGPTMETTSDLLFAQVEGGYWKELKTFSAGFGWRHRFGNWAAGINGFADLSQSQDMHNFYQVGVGTEVFGRFWEVRANGYWPSTRARTLSIQEQTALIGTEIRTQDMRLFERAYRGVDVEGGYGHRFRFVEVWGYAGYFRFNSNLEREMQGPRLRGEAWLFNYLLRIGAEWEWDKMRGSELSLLLTLRWPNRCRRMDQPVRRERGVWVRTNEARRPSELLGQVFFVKGGANGAGSRADPTSLESALSRAEAGDTIFLLAGEPIRTEGIVLAPEQIVMGFGDENHRTIYRGGRSVVVRGSGRGEIVGETAKNGALMTINSTNMIVGIGVHNQGEGTAISLRDAQACSISQCEISTASPTGNGILIHQTRSQSANFSIEENWINAGSPITLVHDGSSGLVTLDIHENTLAGDSYLATGIALMNSGDGKVNVDVKKNRISGSTAPPIVVDASGGDIEVESDHDQIKAHEADGRAIIHIVDVE